MKNVMLRSAIAADLAVRGTVSNTIARARDLMNKDSRVAMERGDIVQTIIIIAMFVLIVMVVGGILMAAIQGQAEKVGQCIENANSGQCNNFGNGG